MAEVVVVASVKVQTGHEEEVVAGLSALAAQSHEEEGCLRYALHRGLDDPTRLVLVECWASREALDEHFTKPYVQAVGDQVHLLEQPAEVHFLEPVPAGDPGKGSL
jgi:quinol monooxygenase YgiN